MSFINLIGKFTAVAADENLTSGIFANMLGDDAKEVFIRVLLAAVFGVIIAVLCTIYNRKYLGGLVRKLISEAASSPETAKTLYELGYDDKLGVRFALKRGIVYARYVVCVEHSEAIAEYEGRKKAFEDAHKDEKRPPKFKGKLERVDYDTARFYVPEEKQAEAGDKYASKGSSWIGLCLVLIIIAVFLALVMLFLPQILKLLSAISSI